MADLERLVSKPRLDRYRPQDGGDLETAVNYLWNVALSEALLQGIAAVEVGLRNTVHNAMTKYCGTEYWFQSVLKEVKRDGEVHEKWTLLSRRHKLPPRPGKIIAELTFGFWPPLFDSTYQRSLVGQQRRTVQGCISYIPTGVPPHLAIVRKDVYQRGRSVPKTAQSVDASRTDIHRLGSTQHANPAAADHSPIHCRPPDMDSSRSRPEP
ncbi:MAG: hypothetical protein R2848_18120 [Thermomicrobiales bacterium]